MTIEIDETRLHEMEEDLENYVKLVKRYDDAIVVKNELIKRYEKELNLSKKIIVYLLESLKERFADEPEKIQILTDLVKDVKMSNLDEDE